MSVEEAKLIYTSLLENNELEDLLPGAIGEWSADKTAFLNLYKRNQEAIEILQIDLDAEDYDEL
jgi:hypothetical protein